MDPLEMESWMVVSHHVGADNFSLWHETGALTTKASLQSPICLTLNYNLYRKEKCWGSTLLLFYDALSIYTLTKVVFSYIDQAFTKKLIKKTCMK